MNAQLENQILLIAEERLKLNTRFHDIGHAREVLALAKSLQQSTGGDLDIIVPAAILHDLADTGDKELEGKIGAKLAEEVLQGFVDFPESKIQAVQEAILAVSDGGANNIEEQVVDDADQLAAFTELSLGRALMLNATKGLTLHEAILNFAAFVDKKYQHFQNPDKTHISEARLLAEGSYAQIHAILLRMLANY